MIAQGASDETIAKELQVNVGSIARVRRKLDRKAASERPMEASTVHAASASAPAGADHREDGGLDAALIAAGLGGESLPPEDGQASKGQPHANTESRAPRDDSEDKAAPPSPRAIVALAKGLRFATVKGAATVYKPPFTADKVNELASMPPEEKELLMMFAPHMAEEMPGLLENSPKIAMWAFVLVWGIGTWAGVSAIRDAAKEDKARRHPRAPREPQAAPEPEQAPEESAEAAEDGIPEPRPLPGKDVVPTKTDFDPWAGGGDNAS